MSGLGPDTGPRFALAQRRRQPCGLPRVVHPGDVMAVRASKPAVAACDLAACQREGPSRVAGTRSLVPVLSSSLRAGPGSMGIRLTLATAPAIRRGGMRGRSERRWNKSSLGCLDERRTAPGAAVTLLAAPGGIPDTRALAHHGSGEQGTWGPGPDQPLAASRSGVSSRRRPPSAAIKPPSNSGRRLARDSCRSGRQRCARRVGPFR